MASTVCWTLFGFLAYAFCLFVFLLFLFLCFSARLSPCHIPLIPMGGTLGQWGHRGSLYHHSSFANAENSYGLSFAPDSPLSSPPFSFLFLSSLLSVFSTSFSLLLPPSSLLLQKLGIPDWAFLKAVLEVKKILLFYKFPLFFLLLMLLLTFLNFQKKRGNVYT